MENSSNGPDELSDAVSSAAQHFKERKAAKLGTTARKIRGAGHLMPVEAAGDDAVTSHQDDPPVLTSLTHPRWGIG
jgi:hypothetical protein